MNNKNENKEPSFWGAMMRSVWEVEKSQWRWAATLGLIGAILIAIAGGFLGYAFYGYLGLVGGSISGAIIGWIVATLIFYVILGTASFFN